MPLPLSLPLCCHCARAAGPPPRRLGLPAAARGAAAARRGPRAAAALPLHDHLVGRRLASARLSSAQD
jgi:hypothetical protein